MDPTTSTPSLDGDRVSWFRDGLEIEPAAGTGIAAGIVDRVLGEVRDPAVGGARERAIPVDQTHTSVIVDERRVVKIVGSWGAADRAAAILERLRDAGSTATPAFLGVLEWEPPGRGSSVLALVTEYVPDSEDGWTWAVDDALAHLADDAGEPEWPRALGALTARMHAALRVDPDPGAPDPRRRDRERALAVLDRTYALLDEPGDEGEPRPEGMRRRLRGRRAALAAAIRTIPEQSSAPLVTPHGDFHVGQILRTGDGRYLVLDFDGDPQWGPEQRFRPDGAARDVAHMLVSIDLVAAVVQRRLGGPDERAWAWAEAAQRRFLDAYLAEAREGARGTLLDTSAIPGLMAEQLLLELSYAERYLPVWRYAPDGAIARRYPRESAPNTDENDETESPWSPPASPRI